MKKKHQSWILKLLVFFNFGVKASKFPGKICSLLSLSLSLSLWNYIITHPQAYVYVIGTIISLHFVYFFHGKAAEPLKSSLIRSLSSGAFNFIKRNHHFRVHLISHHSFSCRSSPNSIRARRQTSGSKGHLQRPAIYFSCLYSIHNVCLLGGV